MDKQEKIAISIATFNRAQGLKAVLDGIEKQKISANISLRVIIADNSQDGNARKYIEERAGSYRWTLTYHSEPRPGITYPRNKGLDDALEGGDDYIVFTDDDILVDVNWISELYSVFMETGAAAVCGAVKVKFDEIPPWWVVTGGYAGVDHPDRQSIEYGYAGNSIVRLDTIRDLQLHFDPFFSLTGGEDTAFFKAIRDAGGKIIFARDAIVYECVGADRLTISYWLKRWYRTGNTDGLIEVRDDKSIKKYLLVFSKGIIRTILGVFSALATFPTQLIGRVDTFNSLRVMSRGLGFIASVFGITYEEYRNHNR